jgi:hypothetical protein
MTPIIDGAVHHFRARGLYDGLSLMEDEETGSLWNHITGKSVYGPLQGTSLPVYNLLHTNVEQVLEAYPDIDVAISERPIRGRGGRMAPGSGQTRQLSQGFQATIVEEDTRRPTMEIGLGIWSGSTAVYYPMDVLRDAGGAVVDTLAGRTVVVYLEPESYTMAALYADASAATPTDAGLDLGGNGILRDGVLHDADGLRLEIDRPLQLFTRWYGFALTFPGTTIY